MNVNAESVDESDDEAAADGFEAKASKKKEKRRQEREAQRQVECVLHIYLFMLYLAF